MENNVRDYLNTSSILRFFRTVLFRFRRSQTSKIPTFNPQPDQISFPQKTPFRFTSQSLMGRSGLFDLERHFAFYGAYHSNPVNIFIHMLFVWPIMFTFLMLLHFTPTLFNLPLIQVSPFGTLVLNIGFFLTVVYSLFYVSLDKKSGSLAALLCFCCWVGASFLAGHLGYSLAWKVVLAAQLFCWTGQFVGHGVFEKRAPALLDNLAQAFIMAPFFVLLEALQMLFGYEPYPGFHETVQAKVDAEIKNWQAMKQKKSL